MKFMSLYKPLGGGDWGVLRYQYPSLWYQVPYQTYEVIPLDHRNFFSGSNKVFKDRRYYFLPYLKHVLIEYFEKRRRHNSYS